MSLAEGDYRWVEDKVVETLLADTAAQGLREEGAPPVATIMAADTEIIRSFGQARFPAILIRASGKTESPSGPAYGLVKTFRAVARIFDRGLDRDALENSVRKIAARIEKVMREQTAIDKQFLGLPDLVEDAEGILVCSLGETGFAESESVRGEVLSSGSVQADIIVPCITRYE